MEGDGKDGRAEVEGIAYSGTCFEIKSSNEGINWIKKKKSLLDTTSDTLRGLNEHFRVSDAFRLNNETGKRQTLNVHWLNINIIKVLTIVIHKGVSGVCGQSKIFEEVLEEERASKKDRKRRPGGGRKHTLSGAVEKLFPQ